MVNFLPDKIDDFNFANINLEYGVYFSQLIRSILSFEFSPFTTLPYSKFQSLYMDCFCIGLFMFFGLGPDFLWNLEYGNVVKGLNSNDKIDRMSCEK